MAKNQNRGFNPNSKLLVVDTNIIYSSGDVNAVHPTAQNCRNLLQYIMSFCHRIILNNELKDEWDKHQSNFARRWRVSMISKGKVVMRNIINRRIENTVNNIPNNRIRRIIVKDKQLLHAALDADNIILSMETNVLNELRHLSIPRLNNIIWVNPIDDLDACIAWMSDGAIPTAENLVNRSEQ